MRQQRIISNAVGGEVRKTPINLFDSHAVKYISDYNEYCDAQEAVYRGCLEQKGKIMDESTKYSI